MLRLIGYNQANFSVFLGCSENRAQVAERQPTLDTAIAGGLVGFLLAWLFTPALAKVISLPDGMSLNIRPDSRVRGVAAAATMMAALLAGVFPAFRLRVF